MSQYYLKHSSGNWVDHKYVSKYQTNDGKWVYVYGTKEEHDDIKRKGLKAASDRNEESNYKSESKIGKSVREVQNKEATLAGKTYKSNKEYNDAVKNKSISKQVKDKVSQTSHKANLAINKGADYIKKKLGGK